MISYVVMLLCCYVVMLLCNNYIMFAVCLCVLAVCLAAEVCCR
jgi:hypothetical protein